MEKIVDRLEIGGAQTDADRHREHADDGDAGISQRHARGELHVQGPAAEPGEPEAIAQRFLVPFHAAEHRQGAASRFVAREVPLTHQLFGGHVDVELELAVHSRFGRAACEEQPQTCAGTVDPFH